MLVMYMVEMSWGIWCQIVVFSWMGKYSTSNGTTWPWEYIRHDIVHRHYYIYGNNRLGMVILPNFLSNKRNFVCGIPTPFMDGFWQSDFIV